MEIVTLYRDYYSGGTEGHGWHGYVLHEDAQAAIAAAVERCAALCDERARTLQLSVLPSEPLVSQMTAMVWQLEATAEAIRATLATAPKEPT